MKKITKNLLLAALALNFAMLIGIIIFTQVNWNDTWVLALYACILFLVIWVSSGKVRAR